MEWLNKVPEKNKNLAWRIIDGEIVILHLENRAKALEQLYLLKGTAVELWQLVDGERSVEDILKKIMNKYDIKLKDAKSDIIHFFSSLLKERLIDFM